MREALAEISNRRPRGFPVPDLVLAAFIGMIAVASVLTGHPDEGPISLTLPVAVVTTAALAWRRRLPAVAVLLVVTASLVQTVLTVSPGSLWSLAVYAIVMYSVATWCTEALAAALGALLVGTLLVEERLDSGRRTARFWHRLPVHPAVVRWRVAAR